MSTVTKPRAQPIQPGVPTEEKDVDPRHPSGGLISALEDIQAKYGYLPEDELRQVAAENGRSLVDVYGVATFYRAFSLKPRGKHLVSVCLGTACHVRGGPGIARKIEEELGTKTISFAGDGAYGVGRMRERINRGRIELIVRTRTSRKMLLWCEIA